METCDISSGLEGEEAQHAPKYSLSYGALVQQSTTILKNECTILEGRIQEKTRDLDEMKELCSRQAENIAKQQSELGYYKMKTHQEVMQNKSHMSKIWNLRDKLQVLDKYFEKLGKNINPSLSFKTDLEDKIKKLKIIQEIEEARCDQLEKENKYFIEGPNKIFLELQEQKNQETTELLDLETHLRSQLEQKKLHCTELEQELRVLQDACRERQIMIGILEPQSSELRNKEEHLKMELITVNETMKTTVDQLDISLKEVLNRKSQLRFEIEATNQNINETNKALIEKEAEIKMLDCKHKQLNAEEKEYSEKCEKEQEELSKLESTLEELTSQLSVWMNIETENNTLKAISEDLQNETKKYKGEITQVKSTEEGYCEKIQELTINIDKMEIEIEKNTNERLIIEESLKKLGEEQEFNENEHQDLRSKIEKFLCELQDKNDQLKIRLQDLNDQLLKANEDKNEFEKTLKDLESELAQTKTILQESDSKLADLYEKSSVVNKNLIEEIEILNEMVQRSFVDYEKAMADYIMSEKVKKEVDKLEIDVKNKSEYYSQIIQELQDSFALQIQDKNKMMDASRNQCELEYRNKEILKKDAMVELKEAKARIIDLQKQNAQLEKNIVTKTEILRKCDNLIQKMMTKFNKVAQVAITSSQSMGDPMSQQAGLFGSTSGTQRKPVKIQSPGSDSSGRTFNPDDVDLKRISQKRPALKNNQNMFKKKSNDALRSKMRVEKNDDWGFPV